ncbi:MAG: 5-(carboxyamino)imidazole ribonucleotide mutase [Succinivibrionaceae bacterium]|nr:5-(carboxyamino)imidazole ribonucleotide mutase [Succinivibrionaceae bacterium]
MSDKFVAILMGSDSDYATLEPAIEILKSFGVRFEVKVTSAHRTPLETMNFVKRAEERGCAVFICAAGLAAHLAGAVAANTTCPVIGVPIDCGPLNGIDALLSTVQMPGGIPVATMAIGKAGAKNAAYFAVQILAVSDPELMASFKEERRRNADAVNRKNEALQAKVHGEKIFD